jgi:hypothetical protein
MKIGHRNVLRGIYGLMALMVVFQAAGMALLVYYGADILSRDRSILAHTSTLVNDVAPGLQSDVASVSRSAAEIKMDVMGLRNHVLSVGERVNEVGRSVNHVSKDLDGLNKTANDFIQNRSGLIWGHSLNPYVLISLLGFIIVSIPICAWLLYKRRADIQPQLEEQIAAEAFTRRLDDLSEIMGRLRAEDMNNMTDLELKRIMEETERLIQDARTELGVLSDKFRDSSEEDGARLLH